MTTQLLTQELTTLIQDSRRKNADLRVAAEKSLADLKALPNTSETQLAADLKRRPNFIRPFLLACGTRNVKFAGNAIVCLQRLVVFNGLPQETLKDVLEAFRECSLLGLDIQLKVLQALPTLLQNYGSYLNGKLLGAALEVCFLLYGSKTAVVSNTAVATLQQLVVSVLEKVAAEDEGQLRQDTVAEVPTEHGMTSIRSAALDGYRLLNDLCLMTEGFKPEFLPKLSLPQEFGLELIESMITAHADTVATHPELVNVLRVRLMPLLIKIVSERVVFATTVRVMRLLPVIFGSMLSVLAVECEMALSLLNHMLDPDAADLWKRTLCMEVFRTLHSEPSLIRSIYALFDEHDGKRNIIRDHMATLVRLATEKPTLIGLGQQSSIPSSLVLGDDSHDQLAIQADGVAGAVGIAVSMKASNAPGISTQWSQMRIPCIEQLDKFEPPSIPVTYIYSLALSCINSFSEGLARFLLPFTIPDDPESKRKPKSAKEDEEIDDADQLGRDESPTLDKRKELSRTKSTPGSKLPVNPLSLQDHTLYSQICTSARMIDTCWPALLAACSTFFNAALGPEFYHALVRSFQKFTQVAGLLRLSTPRDAFLTALGKNAVPPAVISAHAIATYTIPSADGQHLQRRPSGFRGNDSSLSPALGSNPGTPRQSIDLGGARLNTRNLLCLRALLNLGIALGPVLSKAWSIILETLQQADLVITQLTYQRRQQGAHVSAKADVSAASGDTGDFGAAIAAVETAASRMQESTSDLSDDAFLDMIHSLKSLLRDDRETSSDALNFSKETSLSPIVAPQNHRKMSNSFAGSWSTGTDVRGNAFVIENLSKLVQFNLSRLLQKDPTSSGWIVITDLFIHMISRQDFDADLRLKASTVISDLVKATSTVKASKDCQNEARRRGLEFLRTCISALRDDRRAEIKVTQSADIEIQRVLLEALKSALEQYGDSLLTGWDCVFYIVESVFLQAPLSNGLGITTEETTRQPTVYAGSTRLVRSSFGSIQLICSDFLEAVPQSCISTLINSIHLHCSQNQDFNISLTSSTLFWNVSDHLWRGIDALDLPPSIEVGSGRLFLSDVADENQIDTSNGLLWLKLLSALIEMTADPRIEIRHSALHTLFRVLNACGDRLSAKEWTVLQRPVFIRMLDVNAAEHSAVLGRPRTGQDALLSSWNETVIIVLDGISRLLEQYLQTMLFHPEFARNWSELMARLMKLLDRQILDVSTAVYNALTRTLVEIHEPIEHLVASVEVTWKVWCERNPASHKDASSRGRKDNQPALMAYLRCLEQIYPLIKEGIDLDKVTMILRQIRICASDSDIDTYGEDTERRTPLQSQLLNCVTMVRPNVPGVSSALIDTLSFFVAMAYNQDMIAVEEKRPTYVAFSKSAMDLLITYVPENVGDKDVYHCGAVSRIIGDLANSIDRKYHWRSVGKEPLIWKKATRTFVTILRASIVPSQQHDPKQLFDSSYSKEALRACGGILAADCSTVDTVNDDDEDFDIDAFLDIRDLVTTALGSSSTSDQSRRTYAEIIFKNSVIHEPHPDDLPKKGQDVLEGLRSTHIGRTNNLLPSPRSKMSYFLLDELFSSVAVHDSTPEQIRLAQAAAPFLILRAGIVLKAYILDQPLRGRMPQPASQKKEMLYILQKLVDLDSDPRAIPDAQGVNSEHKKHLHRLFALVTKALQVSWRDEEMQSALTLVIDVVGQDFGV